jgi:succinate dehydrogenase/fumarate reductase cytochrome b subunit
MRALLASNASDARPEARALVYLLLGCVLIFISQIPGLVVMEDAGEGAAPRDARLAITFFAWLFIWPLMFYALAGLSHLLARLVGGHGRGMDARLALFWTVLTISPLFLLRGLAEIADNGAALLVINLTVAGAFIGIWVACLIEAETGAAQ